MLESIYNVGGGKQQSPLARYLASVGPSAGGAGSLAPNKAFGMLNPGTTLPQTQVDQSGGFSSQPPAAGGAPPANPDGLGPGLGKVSYDYSTDPVLQQMLAGNATDEGDADAQALGARRSVLGQYGDRGLAESVLGAGDPTLGSISDNPDTSTSTLARLKRGYADTVKQNEDTMNANNLFYGGARVKQLGSLAKDEQTQEADANSAVKAALDQIGATLGSTKAGIRNSRIAAEQAAADRAANAAILQALSGGGGAASDPFGTGGASDVGGGVSSVGTSGTPQLTDFLALQNQAQNGDPGAAATLSSVMGATPAPDPSDPAYAAWKLAQGTLAQQAAPGYNPRLI